jgi:hypothetical protein
LLDGAMSSYKNDGLEKWNFFMDHLLDFVLVIAVFLGLSIFFYKRNTKMILPIFVVFVLIMINMVASFLMIAEKGLDLGIKLSNCFAFNIFHMHILLIVVYTLLIIFKGKLKTLYFWFFAIFIGCLTIFNIYKKQDELKEKN